MLVTRKKIYAFEYNKIILIIIILKYIKKVSNRHKSTITIIIHES